MQLYLPIAELTVNMLLFLGMGGAVGFLSGMFGVGGGFLLTPLLIFTGIPPAVAVATVTPQIVASSTSAAISYWRRTPDRREDDGAARARAASSARRLGVFAFRALRSVGQLDLIIALAYVAFLGFIGTIMLRESVRALWRARSGRAARPRGPGHHNWIHGLPLKMRFRRSKLYVSVIPIVALGAGIGFLGSVLGLGGGFIMVPALIYLLRVPTNVVIGTSLAYTLITMAAATVLHATANKSVDIMLALRADGRRRGRRAVRRAGRPGAARRAASRAACAARARRGVPRAAQPLPHARPDLLAERARRRDCEAARRPRRFARAAAVRRVGREPDLHAVRRRRRDHLQLHRRADRRVRRRPRHARRTTPTYQVAVVVQGPDQDVVVRRKERLLGIWANRTSREFVERAVLLRDAPQRKLQHRRSRPPTSCNTGWACRACPSCRTADGDATARALRHAR